MVGVDFRYNDIYHCLRCTVSRLSFHGTYFARRAKVEKKIFQIQQMSEIRNFVCFDFMAHEHRNKSISYKL